MTKLDAKDVINEKTSKYVLTHQNQDSQGEVETHMVKVSWLGFRRPASCRCLLALSLVCVVVCTRGVECTGRIAWSIIDTDVVQRATQLQLSYMIFNCLMWL